jgi:hypothetical protein
MIHKKIILPLDFFYISFQKSKFLHPKTMKAACWKPFNRKCHLPTRVLPVCINASLTRSSEAKNYFESAPEIGLLSKELPIKVSARIKAAED